MLKLYGQNIYVPPTNSYVEILAPNVLVLGSRAFGRELGHGHGINVSIKETPETSLALLPLCEDRMRGQQSATRRKPSSDHTGILISDAQPLEL